MEVCMLKIAQRYIEFQDDTTKEEYYETDKERAESVLCAFLRDVGVSVWRVRFVWQSGEDLKASSHYFVLESTADKYIADSNERWSKASVGFSTEVTKEMTSGTYNGNG